MYISFFVLFWFVCVCEMFQETMTHIKCAVTCIKNNTIIIKKKSTIKYSCHLFACGIEKLVHCHSHFTSAKVYRSAVVAMSLPLSTQTASLLLAFIQPMYVCINNAAIIFFLFVYLILSFRKNKVPLYQMALQPFANSSFQLCVIVWYAPLHMYTCSQLYTWLRFLYSHDDECQT